MDELISKKAVLELLHKLELSLNKEETIPAVLHDIEQMAGQPERKFAVDTPKGPLVAYASRPEDLPEDYPGIFVSLNGTLSGLLACVEYDSANDRLQTCVYQLNEDEPVEVIVHNDTFGTRP